jgi:hypothetical protein
MAPPRRRGHKVTLKGESPVLGGTDGQLSKSDDLSLAISCQVFVLSGHSDLATDCGGAAAPFRKPKRLKEEMKRRSDFSAPTELSPHRLSVDRWEISKFSIQAPKLHVGLSPRII